MPWNIEGWFNFVQWYFESWLKTLQRYFEPDSIFYSNVLNLDLIFSLSSKFHMILVHVLRTDINILPILCHIMCKCYFCDRKQPGGWSVWGRKKSELGQQVPLLKKKWNIWGKSCFKWPWFWCNRIISMKRTSNVLNEV